MGREHRVPAAGIITIVLFSLMVTVLVMALGFAIVSGIAYDQQRDLAGLFAPAAGFLVPIAAVLAVQRAVLVRLREDVAF